jgi:hypothetical protein
MKTTLKELHGLLEAIVKAPAAPNSLKIPAQELANNLITTFDAIDLPKRSIAQMRVLELIDIQAVVK